MTLGMVMMAMWCPVSARPKRRHRAWPSSVRVFLRDAVEHCESSTRALDSVIESAIKSD